MDKRPSWLQRIREDIQELLDERILRRRDLTRFHKFAHFCLMVARSFVTSRCPLKAAGLAYVTLLALIPMLAVIMSVTSTFLKQVGEERIDQVILQVVASITPPAKLSAGAGSGITDQPSETVKQAGPAEEVASNAISVVEGVAPVTNQVQMTSEIAGTNQVVVPAFVQAEDAVDARRHVARSINEFIQNTRSGTMGVTGSVVLIFVAISMLVRIEEAFNEIWGAVRGRTWFMRVVLYWGVISLAPILLVVALGLATGPYLEGTKEFLLIMPFVGNLVFLCLPVVVLSLTFTMVYIAIPNTKVRWDAALAGGTVAGCLFHLNNMASVLYVSRVIGYSKIYGSLGMVPVLMVGLYLSWLILLLGAHVAYAFQNRTSYLEEKQVENINQRGREFVALRLMTVVGQHFMNGQTPPTVTLLSNQLSIPCRLIRQIMRVLACAHLVVETTGADPGFVPARPIETITCFDILEALRANQGEELATRDEPTRAEVYGEFQRMQEAEARVASSVDLLSLVSRAQSQLPEQIVPRLSGPRPG